MTQEGHVGRRDRDGGRRRHLRQAGDCRDRRLLSRRRAGARASLRHPHRHREIDLRSAGAAPQPARRLRPAQSVAHDPARRSAAHSAHRLADHFAARLRHRPDPAARRRPRRADQGSGCGRRRNLPVRPAGGEGDQVDRQDRTQPAGRVLGEIRRADPHASSTAPRIVSKARKRSPRSASRTGRCAEAQCSSSERRQ